EYAAVGKADRLQYRQLWNALTYRLRHGVARQQHQREEHRTHDGAHDQTDVSELADEARIEGLLGLRFGLVVGVLRERIDRLRDLAGRIAVGHLGRIPADIAVAEGACLIEIVPIEVHGLFLVLLFRIDLTKDSDQIEDPGIAAALLRKDRRLQRD